MQRLRSLDLSCGDRQLLRRYVALFPDDVPLAELDCRSFETPKNKGARIFYEDVFARFNVDTKTPKATFVCVIHPFDDAPFYVNATERLGPVVKLILKRNQRCSDVIGCLEVARDNVVESTPLPSWRSRTFGQGPQVTTPRSEKLAISDAVWMVWLAHMRCPDRPVMIMDHGGYFASFTERATRWAQHNKAIGPHAKKIHAWITKAQLGIVEHTENGHQRYADIAPLPFPIWSVAETRLKHNEAEAVGRAIVAATKMALGSFSNKTIFVAGFGRVGQAIAQGLKQERERGAEGVVICVYDRSPVALAGAIYDFDVPDSGFEMDALARSDLIVCAGEQVITEQFLQHVKDSAYILSVTSLDSMLSDGVAERFDYVDPSRGLQVHEFKVDLGHRKKTLKLLFSGNAANLQTGGTNHAIVHAVNAAVLISVVRLMEHFGALNHIQQLSKTDQENLLGAYMDIIHSRYFDPEKALCTVLARPELLRRVPQSLWRQVALQALKRNPTLKEKLLVSPLTEDEDFAADVMQVDGTMLRYFVEFQGNEKIARAAVAQNARALAFVDDRLRAQFESKQGRHK